MEIDPIISQRKTRELLGGVSNMTIYRRRRDPNNPLKPAIKVNNRNYDRLSNVMETIEYYVNGGKQ